MLRFECLGDGQAVLVDMVPAREESAWPTTATAATFLGAVLENEEVVPVNAVSTWVLPSGVTVGR